MKNTVIEFFQNLPESRPEQFNKAFELYRQSPGKSESTERVMNAMGFSDSSLNNLMYDLQKLHGITDIEKIPVAKPVETPDFRIELLNKVVGLVPEGFSIFLEELKHQDIKTSALIEFANEQENDLAILALIEIERYADGVLFLDFLEETSFEEIQKEFSLGVPKIEDLESCLELATKHKRENAVEKLNQIIEGLKVPATGSDLKIVKDGDLIQENEELKNQNDDLLNENEDLISEKEDLQDENEGLKDQLEKAQALPKISAESLRVEFPFLKEKDCPNELKILVADKITVWNEYLALQEDISKAEAGEITLTKEDLEAKAKRAVECFDENQKIYEELNVYNLTAEVLGKHPIFRTLKLQREVDVMTNEQLINYKNSTSKFFSDNKKKLAAAEKAKDLPKIEALKSKMEERTERLALVNKKLGV